MTDSEQVFLLGGAVLLMTLLMARARARRRAGGVGTFPEPGERQAEAARGGVVQEMERIVVELDGIGRRFQGRMEMQTQLLDRLCAEADRKIAELRALLGDAGAPGAAEAADAPPPPGAPARAQAPPAVPDGHRDVYRLADEGLDARAIAQRLRRDVGEIQLILAIRRGG